MKVRRTFNIISPFLGEGGKGDGVPGVRQKPSPSMPCGIATSPEGRGKGAPMQLRWEHVLAPPLGELSPQVTERAPRRCAAPSILSPPSLGKGVRGIGYPECGKSPLRQCLTALPPLPKGEARALQCRFALYKAGRPRLAGRRLAESACGLARRRPLLGSPFGGAVTAGD